MIQWKQLTRNQIVFAIDNQEFPPGVIASAKHVAILLSQGWCPQWHTMKFWLSHIQTDKALEPLELDLYEFVYNESDLFEPFLHMKETRWGNDLVPYVRYYTNGKLVATSNFASKSDFLTKFS